MNNELVAITGALHAFVVALIGVAKLFGWIHWTEDQTAAVLATYGSFIGLTTIVVRSKVTPVGKS